ncbi:glycosyl transferase family 2 [Neolewinella xylanilytica]|uniref:Glycosyl transferase family 2 n=1 Tax=Neolewinella xylanilytica TaxID=1514080 RepID=A0A2S6I9Z6_9BACT|nr:glycosyl transferase family 2 [Neolewinella xylanilytica]
MIPVCLPPVLPSCKFCVTIPAKNEAAFLRPTLEALANQLDFDGSRLDPSLYEVMVLANNCTDATAAVARRVADEYPAVPIHVIEVDLPDAQACVGVARKLMMDEAARRLPEGGIIAMTDADTVVDPHWIAATLRAFGRGARAVGGRILVPPNGRRDYRKIHLQDVTYRSLRALLECMIDPSIQDPWPRHFQHYGPSLAVSREAYVASGGMPPLRSIEDAAFAWALERIDVEPVHDPAVRVYTSDRVSNRIEGVTFSQSLEEWAKMVKENRRPVVFGLQHCIDLYKWKVALRRAFYERRIGSLPAIFTLAAFLELSPGELQRTIVQATTFGALYLDIRQRIERTHSFSDRTFEVAIQELRTFTRSGHQPVLSAIRPADTDRRDPRVRGKSRSAVG